MFEKVNQIIHFWLGKPDEDLTEYAKRWWIADPEFDESIRQQFKPLHEACQAKKLEAWRDSPKSCLAYIILIDQFSRNMFRGSDQAFAMDDMALQAAVHGIEHKLDRDLNFIERHFFYMPLEHSEDILHQQESLVQFKCLLEEAKKEHYPFIDMLKNAYEYAIKHYEVIEQFGRFPHRNVVLNRNSTKEELVYLQEFPGGF